MIKAFEELSLWKQGFSLLLIGQESFKDDKLNRLIQKVSLASNGMILRIRDVPNDDLIKFYNAATLAIFPSLCEGFGIPPIESAVLKTSTICSDSTAMKDFAFFKDRLFDATSKDTIKATITKFLEKESVSNQSDELLKISDHIKEKYTWNRTAQKLKSLILNDN